MLPESEQPCVWMRAGVLTWWICDRGLQCDTCPLDAALSHDATRAVIRSGEQRRRKLGRPKRRRGRRRVSSTPRTYRAERSPIREVLWGDLPQLDPLARYTNFHMWVRVEAPFRLRIGVDPFLARIVGRLRSVVLVEADARVRKGRPCGWLTQPGGVLTLRSPISGVVLERNENLCARSDFELQDPFEGDWLLLLQAVRMQAERRSLQDARTFQGVLQRCMLDWRRTIYKAVEGGAEAIGRTMADGGIQVRDLEELLGEQRLHEIAADFLGRRRR
jgi:glycine cleavage system H lipoate-binding protein